jgi:hypothetical protein
MRSYCALSARAQSWLASLLILALAAGCGPSRPSDSGGEATLRRSIDDGDATRLTLRSFTKTDGRQGELMGVPIYSMMFVAEAEFVSDAMYTTGSLLSSEGGSIKTTPPRAGGSSLDDLFFMSQGLRPAQKGDVLLISGQIDFEKRESGWVGSDVTFRLIHDSVSTSSASSAGGGEQNSQSGVFLGPTDPRCEEFFGAQPASRVTWLDRILRRRPSAARQLPETDLVLWDVATDTTPTSSPVGSIAVLATREVCLGSRLAMVPAEVRDFPDMRVTLTSPNSDGYRVLAVEELFDGGRARLLHRAWLVHPDSGAVIGTLFDPGGDEGEPIFTPTSAHWSPDGRYLAIAHREFLTDRADTALRRPSGILLYSVPAGQRLYFDMSRALPPSCQGLSFFYDILEWSSANELLVQPRRDFVNAITNPREECFSPITLNTQNVASRQ